MLDNTLYFDTAASVVAPYMFAVWGKVAEVIFSLLSENGKVDPQEAAFQCSKMGYCDRSKVFELVANAIPDNLPEHCEQLRKQWLTEQEIALKEQTIQRLQAGEKLEDVLASEDAQRETLHGELMDKDESRTQMILGFLDEVIAASKGKGTPGFTTGKPILDKMTGGLVPGRVIILAGRPAMGKTTDALDQAIACASSGCSTAFFSLEMDNKEILEKVAQKQTGIPRHKMRANNEITEGAADQVSEAMQNFFDVKLYLEDKCFRLADIKNRIRQYVRKYGVKVVFIDYLQLISDDSRRHQGPTDEVGFISKQLKRIARAEGVCVVLLSQLSRAVEMRGDKRPKMSDLRQSGQIEQDADIIIFYYRGSYYNIHEDERGVADTRVEIRVEKNRHNSNGRGTVYGAYNPIRDVLMESLCQRKEYDGEDGEVMMEEPYNATAGMSPTKTNDDEDIPF